MRNLVLLSILSIFILGSVACGDGTEIPINFPPQEFTLKTSDLCPLITDTNAQQYCNEAVAKGSEITLPSDFTITKEQAQQLFTKGEGNLFNKEIDLQALLEQANSKVAQAAQYAVTRISLRNLELTPSPNTIGIPFPAMDLKIKSTTKEDMEPAVLAQIDEIPSGNTEPHSLGTDRQTEKSSTNIIKTLHIKLIPEVPDGYTIPSKTVIKGDGVTTFKVSGQILVSVSIGNVLKEAAKKGWEVFTK